MMKKIFLTIVLLFALCGLTQADTMTIQTEGVTIRSGAENVHADTNFLTSSDRMMVGSVADGDYMRGVAAFSLDDPLLAGAMINSVTVTLNPVSKSSSRIEEFTIQECLSFVDSEVTWSNRDASTLWATEGGDYGAVLDSKTVDVSGPLSPAMFTFSGEALATTVANNLGGTFYSLFRITDESGARSFASFSDVSPLLTIDYTSGIKANTPLPADGDSDVDTSVTFGWKPGLDPNNYSVPNPAIQKYILTYRTGDPNFLAAGTTTVEIDADDDQDGFVDTDAVYGPVTFGLDQVVYWQVDEIIADANDILGSVWSFSTLPSTAELNPELPADTTVDVGEYAELTVDAANPFTGDATGLSYQWMYSPDGVTAYSPVGTDSPVLSIASAQVSNEGYYYCDVTVDSSFGTISSGTALLIVKQTLAHWTMNQTDYVGGQYIDIEGGHNATPPETPAFVAGAGPAVPAEGAAVIDPNSYGVVGAWNPLETTGQITLSAWINWDNGDLGSGGTHIIAKKDTYTPAGMMWELRLREIDSNGNAGIRFYSHIDDGMLVFPKGVVSPNTWTHVCAVYGSGKAQVYVNGLLVGSDNFATMSTGTDALLTIGGPVMFPGAFDNVMIHNYAMGAEDVATLYYQTSQDAPCLYPPALDLNDDCEVNIQDFAIFAQSWLECGKIPSEGCGQ